MEIPKENDNEILAPKVLMLRDFGNSDIISWATNYTIKAGHLFAYTGTGNLIICVDGGNGNYLVNGAV